MDTSSDRVPRLSLRDFRRGTNAQKLSFAGALGDAFRRYGFAVIVEHDLEQGERDAMYRQAKVFFAKSDREKNRFAVAEGIRGYTGRMERAKGYDVCDLKEFWHVGQENPPSDCPLPEAYPPNLWPNAFDQKATMHYYRQNESIAFDLLTALDLYVGEEERKTLAHAAQNGNSVLRFAYYPPINTYANREIDAERAKPHADVNYLTLMPMPMVDGQNVDHSLEILRPGNTWLPISIGSDELVIDGGDMLELMTGGFFAPTIHRVVNPADATKARYSIPFFVHPRPEVLLASVAKYRREGLPPPMRAYDFMMNRFRDNALVAS